MHTRPKKRYFRALAFFLSIIALLIVYLPMFLYMPVTVQYLIPSSTTPGANKDKLQKTVHVWQSITRNVSRTRHKNTWQHKNRQIHHWSFENNLQRSVPGWGRNVSRNTSHYVLPDNVTTIINVKNISLDLFLLVVVCSSLDNLEQRIAIRDTWATLADNSTNVIFLLGKTNNSTLQDMILEESDIYKDIVQEEFEDTYNNLTIKSVMMLKWARKNSFAKFLMKVDDDIYVNLPAILQLLKPRAKRKNLLVGHLICKAKPVRDPSHKWYMPYYIFSRAVFPNYLSGSGYLMSLDVVSKLYSAALVTPIVHLEDVYITGICAQEAGVQPLKQFGFFFVRRNLSDSCNPSVLTNHRLYLDDLRISFSYVGHCPPIPLDPLFKRLSFIPQCKYK